MRSAGRKSTRPFFLMHLLYLDDAGSVKNPSEEYVILGGVSIFESQATGLITQRLDTLAQSIHPADPHRVEFHASEIFSRRAVPWRGMSREEAQGVIKAVLSVLRESYDTAKAFACAVHKDSYPNLDPIGLAFEDLCSRFDIYLQRLRSEGDRQRGMLIIDEGAHRTTMQNIRRASIAATSVRSEQNGVSFEIWLILRCSLNHGLPD